MAAIVMALIWATSVVGVPSPEPDNRTELLLSAMQLGNVERVFGRKAILTAPLYNDGEHGSHQPNEHIHFVLYTSSEPEVEKQIYLGRADHLLRSGFNVSAPTKIITHGYMSDYLRGPGPLLKPAYFEAYDHVNIILVNWANLAGIYTTRPKEEHTKQWYDIFYFPPARNTELVGNQTAALIEFLVRDVGVKLRRIHLVGHSLGAHVMGYAGLHVQAELQQPVRRITEAVNSVALDPAAPCFESTRLPVCFHGKYRPISRADAEFVDAIHTHARAFGMKRPVGHADFYPNGGFSQPGCPWWTFGICSHQRAIELMADSVRSASRHHLRARRCSSWYNFTHGHCSATDFALVGEHCSPKARGIFFLSTRGKRQERETG